MSLPGNGIFVVRGEISTLTMAIKRGTRWNASSYQDDDQDNLMKQFVDLKQLLSNIEDLRLIEPNIFLTPFLEVIRSEETTGQITSLALSALNKFLSYGLIDPTHTTLPSTVENVADAVTHARFVGADQASDGVVLMKIIQVLRTLMLSPEGSALTNESVCEVMLSCFRICFEPRLNELLRRTAEHALKDIILLLFMRLPQFAEERNAAGFIKKLKMVANGGIEQTTKRRKSTKTNSKLVANKQNQQQQQSARAANEQKSSSDEPSTPNQNQLLAPGKNAVLATTPLTPVVGNIVDMQGKFMQTPQNPIEAKAGATITPTTTALDENIENDADVEENDCDSVKLNTSNNSNQMDDAVVVVNKPDDAVSRQVDPVKDSQSSGVLTPYGLPCIRELLRFLISLCNPMDKQNTDAMIHMGLSMLTIALEVGADSIGKYDTLLEMVKDDLCKNLFGLLNTERLTIFAADLQVCFLLFESQRICLKFQLEYYLNKLSEIIGSENPRTPYEMRELALDNLLQFLRIPSFSAELYINYDCNLYCTNLLEELVKLLSKNSLSATQAIYTIHQISLDGLLTIVGDIERHCVIAKSDAYKTNDQMIALSALGGSSGTATTSIAARTVSDSGKMFDARADIQGTTSGGEESSGVENIANYISVKTVAEERGDANRLDSLSMRKSDRKNTVNRVTHEQLSAIKNKKQTLTQGTELFNQRPDKGIQFLQENTYLNGQLDPLEVAHFLRENSGLDKRMIGEYISKKKNVESKILEVFVKSFNFENIRIDLALRQYLETFRLPGEAPLIFLVMEHFADHWHKCNKEPFANTDAAFRLAYAIIMLNMDQHNHNAKRLNIPMTSEDFQKNLRGLNGSSDFDQEMLLEVFTAIKNEEIIMPAEQTGLVRENYLWKVLLRRGKGFDGHYLNVDGYAHDKDIFQLVWGPTLAALSFIFDRSTDSTYHKSLVAFGKGATISANFMLNDNFNAIILTLCKFTTLMNGINNITAENGHLIASNVGNATANDLTTTIQFGLNLKAQLAMKTVFAIVHEHGDCLRCDGWKNIIDVIVQLFKLKLLPKCLMEVEDFCQPNGKATLILEKPLQKSDNGLFSSLYSYLASDAQRQPTYDEQEIIKIAKRCIKECNLDQIIGESKFLHIDALSGLIRCLLGFLRAPNAHKSVGIPYPEDTIVFIMEFLVKILINNRDRLMPFWTDCRDQIYLILLGSSGCGYNYLLVRTTVALLKLAIYLMRNEELCPVVLQSLKMLIMLKPKIILRISRQISTGMYELLKTSAQNIHTEGDWDIVFTLLECVGAGAIPPDFEEIIAAIPNQAARSEGALSGGEEDSAGITARGYISDSEVPVIDSGLSANSHQSISSNPVNENWIIVNKDSPDTITSRPTSPIYSLTFPCKLMPHSTFALVKCWDSLAFIVRNVAHITPYNFESCVKCIRTFVEASLNGGNDRNNVDDRKKANQRKLKKSDYGYGSNSSFGTYFSDESDGEIDDELCQRYETIAIQLLDLMHTLHTRTAQIFRWWAEEGGAVPQCSALWALGWCPLLQGMARLATDRRRQVRTSAVTCLQRALLVHDLQTLSGPEWESCFKQVLFPLLYELLNEIPIGNSRTDASLLEESRMRSATIMSKVFLHHLTPLISLTTFNELWMDILDYIDKFLNIGSDMLHEAMLESLKNMLLVMHSVRVFHNNDGQTHSPLWHITWKRVGEFLPQLKDELFDKEPAHPHVNEISTQSIIPPPPTVRILPQESIQNILPPPQPVQPPPVQLVHQLQQQQHFSQVPQAPLEPTHSNTITADLLSFQQPNQLLGQHTADIGVNGYQGVGDNCAPSAGPDRYADLKVEKLVEKPQMDKTLDVSAGYPTPSEYYEINQSIVAPPPPEQLPSNPNFNQSPIHVASDSNLHFTNNPVQSNFNNSSNVPYHAYSEFSNIIELPITPSPKSDIVCENLVDLSSGIQSEQQTQHLEQRIQPPQLPLSSNEFSDKNQLQQFGNNNPGDRPVTSTNIPDTLTQSFLPYTQPQQNRPSREGEIFSEYVNNPYNFTSATETQSIYIEPTNDVMANDELHQRSTGIAATTQLPPMNVFQSANYFGSTDGKDMKIPPGSEMLFNSP